MMTAKAMGKNIEKIGLGCIMDAASQFARKNASGGFVRASVLRGIEGSQLQVMKIVRVSPS